MAKSTVVPFDIPSEFSADPLTEVIQAGAKELDLSRFLEASKRIRVRARSAKQRMLPQSSPEIL